jgi:hypothetical protein
MDTLDRLKLLRDYYESTRGVGHTTAMLEGAKNTGGVIIMAVTRYIAEMFTATCESAKAISWREVDRLTEMGAPLAIDNSAMFEILNDAISEIETLRAAGEK